MSTLEPYLALVSEHYGKAINTNVQAMKWSRMFIAITLTLGCFKRSDKRTEKLVETC